MYINYKKIGSPKKVVICHRVIRVSITVHSTGEAFGFNNLYIDYTIFKIRYF